VSATQWTSFWLESRQHLPSGRLPRDIVDWIGSVMLRYARLFPVVSSCDGLYLSIRPQSPYTLFPPHTLYALDIDCPRAVMLTPTTGPLSIRSILVLRSRHCWKGSEWLSVRVHEPSQHRYTGYESVDGAMGRSCRMTSGDDTPGKYLHHCPTLANNLDS
jgi:hypothetical protein